MRLGEFKIIHKAREVGAPCPHDPHPLGETCLPCWVSKKPNWFRDKPCWQPVLTCMFILTCRFMSIQQLMLFQYFLKYWLYLKSICNSQIDWNVIRLELLHFRNNRIFSHVYKTNDLFLDLIIQKTVSIFQIEIIF